MRTWISITLCYSHLPHSPGAGTAAPVAGKPGNPVNPPAPSVVEGADVSGVADTPPAAEPPTAKQ